MASYGRDAKAGFLFGVLGRISSTAAAMASTVILARLLTPHDFGVAATVFFFVQVAQRMTNLGLNTALIRVPELRDDHSSTVFGLNMLFGVVGGLALALAAGWLGDFYRSAEATAAIPVAGLTFAIGSAGTVPGALLARQLRFKALTVIESTYGWIVAIASVVLALIGFGYWSLVYSLLIGAVLDAVMKLWWAKWRPRFAFSRRALRELLSFGAGLHLKRLLDAVALSIDNMLVGRVLGLSALGIYDKAFTSVTRAVTLVSYAGHTVSLSVLAQMQNDPERFRQAFRRITLGISAAAYPFLAGLAASAGPLFMLLFGPQWTGAVRPFQILCVAGALRIYASYVSAAVQAKGYVWSEVWRQGVYVCLIVLAVAAGSTWGLNGVSVGILVATVIQTFLMVGLLARIASVSFAELLAPHLPGAVGAVLVGGAVTGLSLILDMTAVRLDVWARLGIELGLAMTTGLGYLLVCPFDECRGLIRETLLDFAPALGKRLGFEGSVITSTLGRQTSLNSETGR